MLNGKSIKIGRLFGIEIGVNLNWFIIFFILVVSYSQMFAAEDPNMGGPVALFMAVLLTLMLFVSVVAHEYGHALTARQFGIGTKKIILHLFGGVAFLDREPRKPWHEFWIAVAGPIVSIFLGGLFLFLWFVAQGAVAGTMAQILFYVAVLNLFLGIFNCVPGFPLDGGRVVRAVVWAITGNFLKATRFAAWGGVIVGALIALSGLLAFFLGAPSGAAILRFFLGLFVIHLARMSSRQAEFIDAFDGLTAGDLMRPVRVVLPADTLVSDALEYYFQRLNVDQIPVVEQGALLGFVHITDLENVPERQRDWVRVQELVKPYEPSTVVDQGASAITALERFSTRGSNQLPVFDGRRLKGFITEGDFRRAIQRRRQQQGGAQAGM